MYNIKLPNFEGPFDLLLYFIKRDEVNIYDIPIAKITEEFLSYIRLMKLFDLELAGEFILMASTLMYIKTTMLLPRSVDEDGNEIEDPRTLLVERLLEYYQYKEAAGELEQLEENNRYNYYRSVFEADEQLIQKNSDYKNAELFDLLNAFQSILKRKDEEVVEHEVQMLKVTVEEQIEVLKALIKAQGRLNFVRMMSNMERQVIVVTFLALLELLRKQKIFIMQNHSFDDIIIAQKPMMN